MSDKCRCGKKSLRPQKRRCFHPLKFFKKKFRQTLLVLRPNLHSSTAAKILKAPKSTSPIFRKETALRCLLSTEALQGGSRKVLMREALL